MRLQSRCWSELRSSDGLTGARGSINDGSVPALSSAAGHLNHLARVSPTTKWECSVQCLGRHAEGLQAIGWVLFSWLELKGHNWALTPSSVCYGQASKGFEVVTPVV